MHALALLAVVGAINCGTDKAEDVLGNHYYVTGGGPLCLYRAYHRSCTPASYKVTMMGVDTFASLTFTIRRSPCRVAVDGKNTVYTGSPRSHTWHRRCSQVAKRRYGVVVTGCTGAQGDYVFSPPHHLAPR